METQKNRQRKVHELLWTQKQISDIIDSHNRILRNGISDLVNEVGDLKDELTAMRKERIVLLETVEIMNGEIRHLRTRVPKQPSQEEAVIHFTKEESPNEDKLHENDTFDDIEGSRGPTEANELISSSDQETISVQNEEKHIPNTAENTSEEFVCLECNLALSSNENLAVHMKDVHYSLKSWEGYNGNSNQVEGLSGDENVESNHQSRILSHVRGVHENMNNYKNTESDNTSLDKSNLKGQIVAVHNKVEKYACEQCHYVSAKKSNLDSHIKATHDKMKKRDCGECGKSFTRQDCLRRHIDEVHDKMRKYACEHCHYTTVRKEHLVTHIRWKHEKTRTYACEQCDYATAERGTLKRHTMTVHNNMKRNRKSSKIMK